MKDGELGQEETAEEKRLTDLMEDLHELFYDDLQDDLREGIYKKNATTHSMKHNKADYIPRLMRAMEDAIDTDEMTLTIRDGNFVVYHQLSINDDYEFTPRYTKDSYTRLLELETDLEELREYNESVQVKLHESTHAD